MPHPIPHTSSELVPSRSVRVASLTSSLPRQTTKALAALEHQTILRTALVQSEAIVQTEKLHEVDRLSREAMSGQALLRKWSDTLAAGDPFLSDELKFFTDIARMSKGEIIADTVSSFCQEGRI